MLKKWKEKLSKALKQFRKKYEELIVLEEKYRDEGLERGFWAVVCFVFASGSFLGLSFSICSGLLNSIVLFILSLCVFVVSLILLIANVVVIRKRDFNKDFEENSDYIEQLIVKKICEDLKNNYHASFVSVEKLHSRFRKENIHDIVLQNGDNVCAEISYDDDGEMNVKVFSNVYYLEKDRDSKESKSDSKSKHVDVIEDLKNVVKE